MYSADCPKCKSIFSMLSSLVSTNLDKVLEKREVDEVDDDAALEEEFDPIINKGFCKSNFPPCLCFVNLKINRKQSENNILAFQNSSI